MQPRMTTPKEVEIKLEVPRASLPRLAKLWLLRAREAAQTKAEISVYFDTDKQTLRKHGLLLRVRRIGKRHVQTIKATASSRPLERDEWECEIESETPDFRVARDTALEPLLNRKLRRQLKPIFETRVRRTAYCLSDHSYTVEMSVDM